MGSSILSEVDDTSILRTGLSTCYWHPLDWLPASRLLPPRSGLERSDFVLWPYSEVFGIDVDFRSWPRASFRCRASIRSLSERSRHGLSCTHGTRFMYTAWYALR